MDEKIIKISQNNYLVATGDVKQIKGNFTKDELFKIYKLRDSINVINGEINNKKNELNWMQNNKQFHKKELLKFRTIGIPVLGIGACYIGIYVGSILSFILVGIIYTALYCLCEKALKELWHIDDKNEKDERDINISIENNFEKLKEYEKELTEIIERTNYQEIDIDKEKTLDDMFYIEEEIKLYMQESPIAFNSENDDIEEQNENLQYELNGFKLVRRLIPPKNNESK